MSDYRNHPIIGGGESYHTYKGQAFVVDFYPPDVWQCSDEAHTVRRRAATKEQVIEDAHKAWDNYLAAKE
jgi:hypothetical protein